MICCFLSWSNKKEPAKETFCTGKGDSGEDIIGISKKSNHILELSIRP